MTTMIRECAPLCLTSDSGWGGVNRGWARIAAAETIACPGSGVKYGEAVQKKKSPRLWAGSSP